MALPHHPHETYSRSHRPTDVSKRCHRVGKEHHSKSTDAQIETSGRKCVPLRIALLKDDVLQSFFCATPAGSLEHLRRHVHTKRATFDRGAGSITGGLPRTASNIEPAVAHSNPNGSPKDLVVPSQFGIIKVSATQHHRTPILVSQLLARLLAIRERIVPTFIDPSAASTAALYATISVCSSEISPRHEVPRHDIDEVTRAIFDHAAAGKWSE